MFIKQNANIWDLKLQKSIHVKEQKVEKEWKSNDDILMLLRDWDTGFCFVFFFLDTVFNWWNKE